MFSVHHLSDGGTFGAALEVTANSNGPVYAVRHSTTARTYARNIARRDGRAVAVVADDTARYVVNPDGSYGPAPGARATTCQRATARGACFCAACRAERQAARA